jgi:hypothetical protein
MRKKLHHPVRFVIAVMALAVAILATIQPARAASMPPKAPVALSLNTDPPTDPVGSIIQQITNIIFPYPDLQKSFEATFTGWIKDATHPLQSVYESALGVLVGANPGILTPAPGNGLDWINGTSSTVFKDIWNATIVLAVALWPLTLAVIAVIAAKDAVAAANWGLGDVKTVLGQWFFATILSATSIYWIDGINTVSNYVIQQIQTMALVNTTSASDQIAHALVDLTFGVATTVIVGASGIGTFAAVFMALFIIILGITVLTALLFQALARYVILVIVVALAPIVLILGVLPPLKWVEDMWLKALVMVMILGPVNMLCLRFAVFIGGAVPAANGPIPAFTQMMAMLGIVSVLITLDGAVTNQVFGAVQEVFNKAAGTMMAVTALATAALGAGFVGAAGGAVGGAAGGAAGGAEAGGAAGGAATTGAGASSATSAGAGAARSALNTGGSLKPSFNYGAAMRAAGRVMSRAGGPLAPMGTAMEAVGGAQQDAQREARAEARQQEFMQQRQGGHPTPPPPQNPQPLAPPVTAPATPASTTGSGSGTQSGGGQTLPPPPPATSGLHSGGASSPVSAPAGRMSGGLSNVPAAPHPSSPLPITMPPPAYILSPAVGGSASASSSLSGGPASGGGVPSPVTSGGSGGGASLAMAGGDADPMLRNSAVRNAPPMESPSSGMSTNAPESGAADRAREAVSGGQGADPSSAISAPPISRDVDRAIAPYYPAAEQPAIHGALAQMANWTADQGQQPTVAESAARAYQGLEQAGVPVTPQQMLDNNWSVQAALRSGTAPFVLAQDAGHADLASLFQSRAQHPLTGSLDLPSAPPSNYGFSELDYSVGRGFLQSFGVPEQSAANAFNQTRNPGQNGSWSQANEVTKAARMSVEEARQNNGNPVSRFVQHLESLHEAGKISQATYQRWDPLLRSRE